MPQIGVELDPLGIAAALDRDSAQSVVPDRAGFPAYTVEIPSVEFRPQVVRRILHACIGHADLEHYFVGIFQVEIKHHAGRVAGDLFRIGQYAGLIPSVGTQERPVTLQYEKERNVVGAAPKTIRRNELSQNAGIAQTVEPGFVHRAVSQYAAHVDEQFGSVAFRVVQPVECDAIRRRIFDPCMVTVEVETVIPRLDDFAFMLKRRFPPLHAQHRIDIASRRHDVRARDHPVVDLRKAQDVGEVVVVSAAALIFVAGESMCRYHSHRAGCRCAEEPPPACGFDIRVYPLYVFGVFAPGGKDLDFGKADILTVSVGCFEPEPFYCFGCKSHAPGTSVVGNLGYAYCGAVAEMKCPSGGVFHLRNTVVKHHSVDRNLVVPFQLGPRHVHYAPCGNKAFAGPFAAAVVHDSAVVDIFRTVRFVQHTRNGSVCQRGDVVLPGPCCQGQRTACRKYE